MLPFRTGTTEKKKYVSLTIRKKIEILDKVKLGDLPKREIAKQFNIPQSTLSTLIKNEQKIRQASNIGFVSERKRTTKAAYPHLEDALILWIKQLRSKNLPVDGSILKSKAEVFALQMGIENFKASCGWMDKFKKRHGLTFRKICGESLAADPAVADNWRLTKFQDILKQYNPDDIFNADETGMFYKLLPDKTLVFRGETCSGGKRAKERLTVMVAANMSGTEKIKLLVVGKYGKPRCFKGIRSMPVVYRANKNAWMTRTVFEEWVRSLDRKFSLANRKVVIVVDNCSAHGPIENLAAIRIEFLPPNVTSLLQPMDQGVIHNLKVNYRRMLLSRMVLTVERGTAYEINILGAIHLLSAAWEAVLPSTLANCFRHAGFVQAEITIAGAEDSSDEGDNQLDPTESNDLDSDFAAMCNFPEGITMNDYVNIDEQVDVHGEMSDNDIIDQARISNNIIVDSPSSDEDIDDLNAGNVMARPTINEFLDASDLMRRFFESFESTEESIKIITGLENKGICASRYAMKQDVITHYFRPI